MATVYSYMENVENRQASSQPLLQEERVTHILLLGEADFSFARALALRGGLGGVTITATELGTPQDVSARYFGGSLEALAARCEQLDSLGVRVMLGVDVTRLECNDVAHRWHRGSFVQAPLWCAVDDAYACPAVAPSPPVSHVIFNFPHTTRPGKTSKLLQQMFRSVRMCIASGFMQARCNVELRLRHVSNSKDAGQLIRSKYGHEEAAAAMLFDLISVDDSDLDAFAKFGYEHRSTKRNARCGHLELVHVWRWRAAAMKPPSVQRLPESCHARRDVFYAPEALLDRRLVDVDGWKGTVKVPQYLVRWRGHPGAGECTWESSKDLDVWLRKAYDNAQQVELLPLSQISSTPKAA